MNKQAKQRQLRIRKKIRHISDKLRLSVHRSNKYLSAQIIDDKAGKTVLGLTEKVLPAKAGTKTERAKELGMKLAELAKQQKITTVVFDKGSYAYHGRVRALAEGAREGGLQF